jgi:N-acetylmuramoyl-L-alanine amidase
MTAFDVEMGARTCWLEARSEGVAGITGVAWSIANRARIGIWWYAAHGTPHPLFGSGHVAETVLDPWQYSSWNLDAGDWRNRRAMCILDDADSLLQTCRDATQAAIAQTGADPTGGATHYFDDSIAPPAWAAKATFTVKIGRLSFYRDVP